MATTVEKSLDSTPIRRTTDEEKRNAAISLAEAALHNRWNNKHRVLMLGRALEALGIDLAELQEEKQD